MADSNAEGTAARERLQAIRRAIARLPASDEIDGGTVERVSEEHTVRQILDDPEAGTPVEGLCMEQVHMTVWSTDGRCHTAGCVAAVIATTYPGLSRDEMRREEREARRRGDDPNWTEAIGRVVGTRRRKRPGPVPRQERAEETAGAHAGRSRRGDRQAARRRAAGADMEGRL